MEKTEEDKRVEREVKAIEQMLSVCVQLMEVLKAKKGEKESCIR